jgi:hypothetical protein
MRRFQLALWVLSAALSGIMPPAAAAQVTEVHVNRSIAAGVVFLKRTQHPLGYWTMNQGGGVPAQGGGLSEPDYGTTALAGLALLECEVGKDDPAIQRTANFLRGTAANLSHTYSICLYILFLDRLGEERDKELIRVLGVRLLAGQTGKGGWSYNCPLLNANQHQRLLNVLNRHRPKANEGRLPAVAYPIPPGIGLPPPSQDDDNSNTQFAILALWVARRHDVPVEGTLRFTEMRFRMCQNQDGGWGYKCPDPAGTTRAMTCAGILSLGVGHGAAKEIILRAQPLDQKEEAPKKAAPAKLGDLREDRAVLAAQALISTHIGGPAGQDPAVADPRGGGDHREYYYYWSLERVAVAFGWRTINGKDWYAWGSTRIVMQQNQDGSWSGSYAGPVDTAFALLFLRRSNLTTDLTMQLRGEASLRTGVLGKDTESTPGKPSPTGEGTNQESTSPPRGGRDLSAGTKDASATQSSESVMIEARRLGQQLVAATGARQDETLQVLVKSKGSAYTQALVDAIPKLDAKGRNQARDALAERLSRMTAETLRGYLQEGNPELRRAAAWACVLKEAKERIPDLIPLLADRDAAVVETVHAALKHMTGTDQGKSIEAWKSWLEKQQE